MPTFSPTHGEPHHSISTQGPRTPLPLQKRGFYIGLFTSGIALVLLLISRGVSAQSTTARASSDDANVEDVELDKWVRHRSEREILILDALVNKKDHKSISERETLEFGFLNAGMIERLHHQQSSQADKAMESEARFYILNPDAQAKRLTLTAEDREQQRKGIDAFLNAFPQTLPASASNTRETGGISTRQ